MKQAFCSPFATHQPDPHHDSVEDTTPKSISHTGPSPFDQDDQAVYTFVPIANISPVQESENFEGELGNVVSDMGGTMDGWMDDVRVETSVPIMEEDEESLQSQKTKAESPFPQPPKSASDPLQPHSAVNMLDGHGFSGPSIPKAVPPSEHQPLLLSPSALAPVTHSPFLAGRKAPIGLKSFRPLPRRSHPSIHAHLVEESSEEDIDESTEYTPSRKRKRAPSLSMPKESSPLAKIPVEECAVDPERHYSMVQKRGDLIQGNIKGVHIQVKTRADPDNSVIPSKLYSSLKYEVSAKLQRSILRQKPAGVYMCSINVVDPDDHDTIIKKNETEDMIAGISQHTAMNMGDDDINLAVRLRFTDVSAHHNKRDFRLKLEFFDSGISVVDPVLTVLSGSFQIFARRPKQTNRPLKRRKVKQLKNLQSKKPSLNLYKELLEQLFLMKKSLNTEEQQTALKMARDLLLPYEQHHQEMHLESTDDEQELLHLDDDSHQLNLDLQHIF